MRKSVRTQPVSRTDYERLILESVLQRDQILGFNGQIHRRISHMSLSTLFMDLGAPLKNRRWSWGAINPKSGAVFLRVWADETQKYKGRDMVRLADRSNFERKQSLGYAERQRHIQLLCDGRPGYLIFCHPKEPTPNQRILNNYQSDLIFPTAEICEVNGDIYVFYKKGLPFSALIHHRNWRFQK